MSEVTVETGELPVCVNCQFKHAVGLLHHVDPSMEKAKYGKTIGLINDIGGGLMMTSQEIQDFIAVYELEHKVEDSLTVLRDLRHKIMEGSEERFEALGAGGNPGNPDGKCSTYREVLGIECRKAKRIIDKERGYTWPFCDVLNEYFTVCSSGDNPGNRMILEACDFTKEPVKPKGYFDPDSFRTICPECPEQRCALCPPELACATRIITGCKEGEFIRGRCQVGTEAHVFYHG